MARKGKFSLLEAEKVALRTSLALEGFEKIKVCGSLRRKCETVGDLDYVIVPKDSDEDLDQSILRMADEILTHGTHSMRIILKGKWPMQVDFMFVEMEHYESAILHSTGSKLFNIKCRQSAQKLGLRLSQYGLLDSEGRKVADREEEILEVIGMSDFLDPVTRSL